MIGVVDACNSCIGHVAHAQNDKNLANFDDIKLEIIHNNFNSDREQDVVVEDDNVDVEHDKCLMEISTPSISTLQSCIDQPGFQCLEMFLLGNYESGIVASLFNKTVFEDIHKLRLLLSLHGIMNFRISIDDCRALLFRHVFSGQCVSSRYFSRDRTACLIFSKGFKTATEMSFEVFRIMSSATTDERSNDDFLHLFRDLEIFTDFRPRNVRRQIIRELQRQGKDFLLSRATFFRSDVFFVGFFYVNYESTT